MDANPENQKLSFLAQLQLATSFLTRMPIRDRSALSDDPAEVDPTDHASEPAVLADAMWLFPLVGFGVGGVGAITLGLLTWLDIPATVAATLAVGAMIWLTGALHEDGLADIADGFGGGEDKDSKLRIMRDSRVGTYGIVAVAILLIAKIAALAALADWSTGAARQPWSQAPPGAGPSLHRPCVGWSPRVTTDWARVPAPPGKGQAGLDWCWLPLFPCWSC